jgi:hypothetical protein
MDRQALLDRAEALHNHGHFADDEARREFDESWIE